MITFYGLKTPIELEKIVQQYCPQNDSWNDIVEMEKELYELRSTMDEGENDIIAYEITDGTEVLGLVQYRFNKAGFLKKEKLVIDFLTLFSYSPDVVREVHRALIQKHNLSGQLIHALTKAEEQTPICQHLKQDGFAEHRNNNKHPKYGYEPGSLYFVKQI